MAFIPGPANTMRATIRATLANEPMVNVLHCTDDDLVGPTVAKANAIFTAWNTSFVGVAAPYNLNDSYVLQGVDLLHITAPNGVMASSTLGPVAGLAAGAALPNSVAVVVTWRTGMSGAANRGRSYLGGIDIDHTTGDNFLGAAFVTSIGTGAANLIADMGAAGVPLVIVSYFLNGAPRATGVKRAVTFATVNARLDSQRRRMPR